MGFKKVVVPVTGTKADAVALAAGFAAASPFAGHVQALFISPDPRQAVPFIGLPVSPEVVQQIVDNAVEVAEAAHKAARANVEAAAAKANVALVGAQIAGTGVTCSFYRIEGAFIAEATEAAKLADLIVFAAPMMGGGPDVTGAVIESLMHVRRPVLLAPEGLVRDLATKVTIGWDGGIAAAHALAAAVPLLKQAGAVEICSVGTLPRDAASQAEALAYLALHGVEATARQIDAAEAEPGAVLLNDAETSGATLLVLGGYGHSRVSETFFGGTTMHVVTHAALPVFMTH